MRFYLALTLLVFFFSACENGKKALDIEFDFIPNPQEVPKQVVTTLKIGAKAPFFRLPGSDSHYYTLDDFEDSKILAIIFTCNHCPTAQAYEERIKQIHAEYKDNGVQLIAISPNSPLGLLYEELGYSDLNDDFEDMKIRARDHNFDFPYLYDGDDQKVSLEYGPAATPHCFVFDQNRELQYVGRIDKSEKPGTANGEDLRAALDALIAGEKPTLAETKTFGCSTKWGWKTEDKKRVDKEWGEKPVALTDIDIEGVRSLISNSNSEKLRLINVWATWCGPCVIEYPEFVVLQRMFSARDFEFISISADKEKTKEKAIQFLQEKQSALQNYRYSQDDIYELIDIVDVDWNGALPYTLLLEPGGKVVWAHQGSVDFLELKRAIVDHPMMGRVY